VGFVARWLTNAINLGLSLLLSFAAMQVPALTHEYTAALLQVAQDVRRDIDQREASAKHFYQLSAASDEAIITALRPFEPSNAETLAGSLDRARSLRAAYDRITNTPPLLQPAVAVIDMMEDLKGYKTAVLSTMFHSYAPQLVINSGSAVYGAIGLMIGSFLAQLIISGIGRLRRSRDRGRRVAT
jgi:hypothetical protein